MDGESRRRSPHSSLTIYKWDYFCFSVPDLESDVVSGRNRGLEELSHVLPRISLLLRDSSFWLLVSKTHFMWFLLSTPLPQEMASTSYLDFLCVLTQKVKCSSVIYLKTTNFETYKLVFNCLLSINRESTIDSTNHSVHKKYFRLTLNCTIVYCMYLISIHSL